jgi:hypothetical protein
MQLEILESGFSRVYNFGSSIARTITLTRNVYGTGQAESDPDGTVVLRIRGDDTTRFNQDDASPEWEEYSVPVSKTWRYIQVSEYFKQNP